MASPHDAHDFWLASMETPNTTTRAMGRTPEQALSALVTAWVTKHCPQTGADPALPWRERPEIALNGGELGEGYVIGSTDANWFPATLSADDPRFVALWQDLAARLGFEADEPGPAFR